MASSEHTDAMSRERQTMTIHGMHQSNCHDHNESCKVLHLPLNIEFFMSTFSGTASKIIFAFSTAVDSIDSANTVPCKTLKIALCQTSLQNKDMQPRYITFIWWSSLISPFFFNSWR